MGKKIFVSYKYADSQVRLLPSISNTKVRDYVDVLQSKLDASDHIYKGENDNEPLSSLADSTIGSKLGDKIFDSTVTIVFISKGMKDSSDERDQWIPWEISYSLREQSREGKISKTNAILAVVLPDEYNSYEYFIKANPACNSTTYMTDYLFTILGKNMFNKKNAEVKDCNGNKIFSGYHSYIYSVKWDNFIGNINAYVDISLEIWRNRQNYDLKKSI